MIYDVLIIGSGIAGLSAAIKAKENGKNVLVVSKQAITVSSSVQAQGGINISLDSKDSISSHIEDTYKSSHNLANIDMIKILCEEAKESLEWIDSMGVVFSKDENGEFEQRRLGGSSHKRACYASDYTGLKIVQTMFDYALKLGVEFKEEMMLLNLIVEEDICNGATFLDIKTTLVEQILANSTIIATGGYSAIYEGFTTNSYSVTGDGIAAAFRAGCRLSNMEFVQFHPTALEENALLLSESARAEGGYLVDSDGKRFVDELQSRDIVSRAVFEKLKTSKVFLDIRHLGASFIKEKLPQEISIASTYANKDIINELVAIAPAAHYSMGGIKTNKSAQTDINNLFACGECADSLVHGANRLGGNSLLEALVFGKIAGQSASNAKVNKIVDTNTKQYLSDSAFINGVFSFSNQIDFYEKREFMGKIFYKNMGLFRTDLHMKAVLSQIRQWQKEFSFMGLDDKSRVYNKNLVEFIEFGNMLELSEIIVVSAISRCESRGSHYRLDYPDENSSFEKISVASRIDGILAVDFGDVR